ncbi:MAG TPA: chromosome segregation protein SMC, partial [Desulfobacteria bacterium]|nr:chromosome segregation protein SMC [Desulfobacteria bacterium]
MYLKRLEIQGFKSLADKIDLQFNPGISVIVGPNGCGKSNIADAIKWVLGEQSAKSLRGAKMEDVIFAGSDKRKQVGMAEVSITLDNSTAIFPIDFLEVTVTRRVYRSGESEYLINKSSCRLKDVHELFMDTGIGREGYSIIGQGKIDEILSVRSEDRRAIIEEAAGIVKYKSRKHQAVRKLEDTEQNLLRINDIIHELETQVGPLEEQSQKAREYLDYKDELSQLEVNLIINQVGEQKETLAGIIGQEENLKHGLIEDETMFRSTESVFEEKKLALTKLDEEIALSQQGVYEIGSSIEKKESGILVAAERLKGIESQKQSLLTEISELRIKEAREREKFSGDEGNLAQVKARICGEQEKLELLEKELDNTDLKFQDDQKLIEDSKADIIDLLNEIASVRNSITTGEANLKTLARRIGQLEEQTKSCLDEYNTGQQELQELQNKKDETQREIGRLTNEERSLGDETEAMKREISSLRADSDKLRGMLQEKASRLRALEELRNSYEGYYRGVKEVLKENKNGKECPGVCGVVAELLKVPEKFETAVEVALGGALQFIVTETDDDARRAIEYLKKKRGGRATFLPLNTIRPNIKDKPGFKNGKVPGFIGTAAEIVSFDQKYKPVVDYLLGKVMIVENIRFAAELARNAENVSRIVTLDGDVVNPGGAMTGGSYQKGSTGLLSREREIEQTGETIKQLEKETKEMESRLALKREALERNISRMNETRSTIQELRMKENSQQKDIQVLVQEKDRIDSARKLAEMEAQSLREEMRTSESGIHRHKELMRELQSKDEHTRNSIEKHSNELLQLEKERVALKDKVTESKVSLAALKQDELNLNEIADRVMISIKEIEVNIK